MLEKIEIDHDREFLSFDVWAHQIRLRFVDLVVEMFTWIEVVSSEPQSEPKVIEDVRNRKGDLNALWPLLGKNMTKLIMDEESCRILFDDGTIVRRKFEESGYLVQIWGPGDEHSWYPADLDMSEDDRVRILGRAGNFVLYPPLSTNPRGAKMLQELKERIARRNDNDTSEDS